ncbi:MAG: discoidin domain-containing protein [Actinomycetaceae bacterium]|nr:discoidin domain-containing protein [Actinomycetaceae bacterium]
MRRFSVLAAGALIASSLTILPAVAHAADTNLALDPAVKATAAGQEIPDRWGPELAIDNDKGGDFAFRDNRTNFRSAEASRWSANNDDETWLKLDLGKPAKVNQVTITWGKQYSKNFDIEVPKDDVVWTKLESGLSGSASKEQTVDLTTNGKGVEARYIRMASHQRSATYAISVWEFEVFGEFLPATQPTDPGTGTPNNPGTPATLAPQITPVRQIPLARLAPQITPAPQQPPS